VNLRMRGRRGAVTGAGAAALMAAAVFVGPAAVATPGDDAQDAANEIQEQVEQAADEVREQIEQAADEPPGEAEQALDEAQQALDEAREQAEEATGEAQGEAEQALDEAQQALDEAREQAEQAAEEAQDQAGDQTQGQAPDIFGDLPRTDPGSWLPDDLQRDLQGLQDLPAGERAGELEDIVHSALGGDYGDEVETWAERITGVLSSMPQDLRQDVQQVFGQEPEEARADVRQIVENAVDGEYGEDVEMWADWLRDTFQRWDLARAIQGSSAMQGSSEN
jgi:ElaB/YqjD/DUF883 family membrane-anchored ribosome-binding protein